MQPAVSTTGENPTHMATFPGTSQRGPLGGARAARSVKCPTLGFGSGHISQFVSSSPAIGLCADGAEPAWDSLSPSLSTPPPLTLSVSQNKLIDFKKRGGVAWDSSRNPWLSLCWVERDSEGQGGETPELGGKLRVWQGQGEDGDGWRARVEEGQRWESREKRWGRGRGHKPHSHLRGPA